MTRIRSSWTITFDLAGSNEFELVEAGGGLTEEFLLEWQQVTEIVEPVESEHAIPLALGGNRHSFRIGVFHRHDTIAALRAFVLSNTVAIPRNISATITIQVEDGATYTLANAVIESGFSKPVERMPFYSLTEYRITGGELALVPEEE